MTTPTWYTISTEDEAHQYNRVKLLLERSKDFHDTPTPFSLCADVIDKLVKTNSINSSSNVLVVANTELVIVIRNLYKEKGLPFSNVYFATPCQLKAKAVEKLGVLVDNIHIYNYEKLELQGFNKMKFDVVIMNPPYKRNLHLDFMNQGHSLLNENGVGICIHPGSWILNEVPGINKVKDAKQFADNHVNEIEFRPSMDCFNIDLGVPISITSFHKQRVSGITVYDNVITNTTYQVNTIDQITKHGLSPVYQSLKRKIMASGDTLRGHLNNNGNFYITMSTLMGNGDGGNFKVNAPFYSFTYKKNAVVKTELEENNTRFFGFDERAHAENFLGYIKSYFARFCLSIAKFDRSLNPITLSTTPWLDFTQQWDDEKLFKHFGLIEEEIQFVYSFIPKFYDDVLKP